MVAWQFTACEKVRKSVPSRYGRHDSGSRVLIGQMNPHQKRLDQTVSNETGSFFLPIPGSKLPDYYHLVPPGRVTMLPQSNSIYPIRQAGPVVRGKTY
jgi:hypothetical protein